MILFTVEWYHVPEEFAKIIFMYYEGLHVEQDLMKAYRLFEQAHTDSKGQLSTTSRAEAMKMMDLLNEKISTTSMTKKRRRC